MPTTRCSARGPAVSFDDLPYDIVHLVLRHFASSDFPSIGSWKRSLNLLAISRQWRRVALPIFYKIAHVVIDRDPADRSNAVWTTNIALAIEGGYLPLVRVLCITGFCPVDAQAFLFRLATIMRLGRVAWSSAVSLHFKLHSGHDSAGTAGERQFAETFAAMLADYMPLISTMNVDAGNSPGALHLFLGSLGRRYAERLTSYCSYMVAPPAVQGASQLTRLEVDWNATALEFSILPHAESLQTLVFHNLPFTFRWSHVCGGDAAPARVVFPSLAHVRVSYASTLPGPLEAHSERVEADHTVVLELPALATMRSWYSPSSCALLFNSVLPARGVAMRLRCTEDALHAFSEQALPSFKRVQVELANIYLENGPITVESVDRMLAKFTAEAGVYAYVDSLSAPVPVPVPVSTPYWTTVRHLTVRYSDLDNVVELLVSLLHLRRFRVDQTPSCGTLLDEYAAKNETLMARLQALGGSQLNEFRIELGINMPRKSDAAKAIREIAARIPGLQQLEVKMRDG
ncbi:hypothetical protein H4R19_000425 [Coemansia spiralis]|nr:hypothetical protein H4R19_000425 [Coemansia spiralis]